MNPGVLRALLIGVILIVQVVTLVSVVLSNQQLTADQFAPRLSARIHLMADMFSDQARRFLEPAETWLLSTEQLISRYSLDASNSELMEQYLLNQLQLNASFRAIELARHDSSYVVVHRHSDRLSAHVSTAGVSPTITETRYPSSPEKWRSHEEDRADYDPREKPWFHDALKGSSVVWSKPHALFDTDDLGLTVAIRVGQSGRSDAVLSVTVGIEELSRFIDVIPHTKGGTAAVVDEEYRVVAYSAAGAERFSEAGRTAHTLREFAGPAMVSLLDKLTDADAALSDDPDDFIELTVAGREHVALVRPFSLSEGQVNWQLLVQSPAESNSGGLQRVFIKYLWVLIAIITSSTLLAIFAIVRLTRPVFDLHQSATRDPLTSALSRGEFRRELWALLDRPGRRKSDRLVCIVALDLDGFKAINDAHGHAAGDIVLTEFVARLRRRLRAEDRVGRIGGDEFLVALQLAEGVDALSTVEQIRRSVVAAPFAFKEHRLDVGVTAGIAFLETDDVPDESIARADHALITGKGIAKNHSYLAAEESGVVSIANAFEAGEERQVDAQKTELVS